MNKSPAFQFYPKDFLTDQNVLLMTNEELGCYIKLLCLCWLHGSIASDKESLARLCGVETERFGDMWGSISKCFNVDPLNGERLVQPRLDKERHKQMEWKEKSSNAGKRSARLRDARKTGTHTEAEWNCLVELVGGVCPRCNESVNEFSKDHVKPIYQGGSDGIDNIQPLCKKCNSAKGPEVVDFIDRAKLGLALVQPNSQPNGNFAVCSLQSPPSPSKKNKNIKVSKPDLSKFEEVWKLYPRKLGKPDAIKHYTAQVKTDQDHADILTAVDNYKAHVINERETGHADLKHQHGSTWFNKRWRDYVELQVEKELTIHEIAAKIQRERDEQNKAGK